MADIRQQIALQVETYTDIYALKAAVLEWASQSDMSPIALEQILAAHQSKNVSYTESDWQQLQQAGFVFDENDEAMREADRQRLQNYRETGQGIPHDRVAAWLSSIGTEDELPCPS